MSAYKKVVLTQSENRISEKSYDNADLSSNTSTFANGFSNSYSSEKVKKLFNEFDSISVDEDLIRASSITKENAVVKTNAISFRTKLYATSSVAVFALLLFLAIYNIFVINSASADIQLLQQSSAQYEVQYQTALSRNQALSDQEQVLEDLANLGYSEIAEENIIVMQLPETVEITALSGQTNWFDAICNFIASIFN